MKKYLTFTITSLILLFSLQTVADPCTTITEIFCGIPVTFAPASGVLGDPNYPAATVCGGTLTQGGLENIYKFIAPTSGIYQFNVISAATANSVEYGYRTATSCNNSGWNCLGIMSAIGIIDAINLSAGDSIFILVNARTTSTTNQTFEINCAIPFACENITTIPSCGSPVTFATIGGLLGDPNFPAATVCGGTLVQGGLEKIYQFIAPSSGTYQFNVISVANNSSVEYGYKYTSPCNNTGWNCLGVMSAAGPIDAINLYAGDSIFILVNSRTTMGINQIFEINCAIPFACENITTIPTCGTPVTFLQFGGLLGDPNFPAATVCGGTLTQGGLEKIYKFIAPLTTTYQFVVNSVVNSNSVEYGYKYTSPCNNTGWNCLGVKSAAGNLSAINLNAGDSIFILVNSRTTIGNNQIFQINCGAVSNPCNSITTIPGCGSPVAFATIGGLLGDPNYPATTVCGGTITQGGMESIYKFTAPSSGTYQFNVNSVANTNSVEYGYKSATTCNNSGWNCLGVMSATGTLAAINLSAGDSIFILVNARTTNTTNQTFEINCAIPFACTNITTIPSCGTPVTFATIGGLLGDPNFPATTVCGGTTTQGGMESIYQFIAPFSGTYQFNVNSVANNSSVEYGYKYTSPCNNTGWNCLGVMSAAGTITAINLSAGDSIFILVNSRTTDGINQTFEINCAIPFACTNITTIPACGTPVTFATIGGLLGDPNFPATTVCGGTTTQGGLEKIYKFIAPSSGTYQFNVNSVANTNSVEYGYKSATPCNNSGWNCLGVMSAAGPIAAINLNAGDSIFVLVNSRTTDGINQIFEIDCSTTSIFENEPQVSLLLLYPNPFTKQTTLFTENHLKNGILTVFNSFGQIVKQINNISGQTILLSRDNLPVGLYFFRLIEDNKIVATDKFIITD